MENNKIVTLKDRVITILVVVFISSVIFLVSKSIILESFFCRYTIGKSDKIYKTIRGKIIRFDFYYKGKEIRFQQFYNGCDTSKRYIVKFSYLDPYVNNFMQDKQVPDSITDIPSEGWKEIPDWVIDSKDTTGLLDDFK